MQKPAAVRILALVLVAAIVSGCRHWGNLEGQELILLSVVGVQPFSDSVSTLTPSGSNYRQILSPAPGVSFMYASGYRTDGPLLVLKHELSKGKDVEDKLYEYWSPNNRWRLIPTPAGGSVGRGVFSPDHSKLAFAFAPDRSETHYKLYLSDSQTSEVKRLTSYDKPEREGYASWSPDGKQILFLGLSASSGHLSSRLLRTSEGSSEPELILDASESPAGAAYSPDGKRICVLSKRGIEIMDLTNRGNRRTILEWKSLPYQGLRFGCISWSVTSNQIAFVIQGSKTKKWELWTVADDGHDPKHILTISDGTVEGLYFLRADKIKHDGK